MKYIDFINNILSTRGRFNCTGYKERHHILPRCLGGLDDEGNLIDLYAREHFIAHKLLHEENPNNPKLLYAYFRMSFYNNANKEGVGVQITPEEYEYVRKKYSQLQKETKRGENSFWFGKHLSEETKKKLSDAKFKYYKTHDAYWKGKKRSEEDREKMSLAKKGISTFPLSEETKYKISQSLMGHYVSKESKEKNKLAHQKKVLCEYSIEESCVFPSIEEAAYWWMEKHEKFHNLKSVYNAIKESSKNNKVIHGMKWTILG